MKLENTGPHLAESEILAFEKSLGQRLPEEFRRFLAENNGGVPEPRSIRSSSTDQAWSVNVLFGLTRAIESSNIDVNLSITDETRPDGYLPIARTDTGELVLFKLDGDRAGSVVLWQWQDDDFSDRMRMLHPLAETLQEFLGSFGSG